MLDLYELQSRPPREDADWIANGILPKGSIFLFGGPTGIGKTFISLNMIRILLEGASFLGHPVVESPESILYLDAEIGEDELASRTRKVFASTNVLEPERVSVQCHGSYITLDTPDGRKALFDAIEACPVRPQIIFIDPISYFMEREDSDNGAAQAVYATFQKAQQIFNKDLTFVVSHHYRKKGQDTDGYDPLDLNEFRGASKWGDLAWLALTLQFKGFNNDGGWNLKARVAKKRRGRPIQDDLNLVIRDKGMELDLRPAVPLPTPKGRRLTWG